MPQIGDREVLRQKINSLWWLQQIDFGGGLLAPGVVKIEVLRAQADAYFPRHLVAQRHPMAHTRGIFDARRDGALVMSK